MKTLYEPKSGEIKMEMFVVYFPDGSTKEITIPVIWDSEIQVWLMTLEAHKLITFEKFLYMVSKQSKEQINLLEQVKKEIGYDK